jgi:iron(III) transport system permease protein
MWGWRSSRTVVIAIAIALFGMCCVLPVAYLILAPLTRTETAHRVLWLDARQQALLWNTTRLGLGTALLATVVGAPLGLALARTALRGKALLRIALSAPALLPPYVVALAWTYLATGHAVISEWAHSLPAAIVVLSLVLYPLSMLTTEVALRRIDGRLEDAALLSAPPSFVLRRITLPLAAPSVLAAALVIFVLSVSEFGVPGLLRVRVYTTEVFTAFAALYDFNRAMLVAVPLLVLCLIVGIVAAALAGDRLVSPPRHSAIPPRLLDASGLAMAGAVATVLIALALPVAVLAREALRVESLASLVEGSAPAIANSLLLATLGATAVVGLAVWLGYARARAPRRLGQLADILFVVAFAVPSTLVGVGLIALWNRPGPVGAVYGTEAMFVLGYLARFVPVAAPALAATMRYVPVSQEEAAVVSGAGWFRTVTRIVLPQIRFGLQTTWVIAFVLAFGELGVSILVAPPGESTLPIRVYTIIANTPASHVAALALLQTAVILTPLASLALVVSLRRAL